MSYASKSGRARTSPSNPNAHAICDRCGFRYNFVNLRWQYDWRGAALANTFILVCSDCYDTPQEQLRAIVVPADPTPIIQARVENFTADSTDYRIVSALPVIDPVTGLPIPPTVQRLTQDGSTRTTQPIGPPNGLEQGAVMPLNGVTHYGVRLPILSLIANGTDQISVSCSAPHGLATNAQISVEGASDNEADGFYSVIVTTATAFTYQVNRVIAAGSLLTSTTNIVTALVGLPRAYETIPQTGI
jgi:hypothetical protein